MTSQVGAGTVRELRWLLNGGTHSDVTDRELLDRFSRRRDALGEAAFAALVTRHGPMVWGVCRRTLRDHADVGDAYQATFLILFRKAGSIHVRDSLGPWLHGVSLRVAMKARSVASRRRRKERTNAELPESSGIEQPHRDDIHDVIDQELARLPARYGEVLVLCLLEGLTHEEAAARLSRPVGTVRSRLARGRELLRSRLSRRGLAPTGSWIVLSPMGAAVESLSQSTIQAAGKLAAGDRLAGSVPASVVTLLQGVDRIMTVTKIALTSAVVCALFLSATGLVAFASHREPNGPSPAVPDPAFATTTGSDEEAQQDPNPPPSGRDFTDFPAFVVKTTPATGSIDVDPSLTEIKVEYSKNMRNGSWSWSQLGNDTYPKLDETRKIHYEKDRRTCVLPVKLEAGKTYAIFCNSPRFHNFKDEDGSPAVPYMLVFRTKKK